MVNGDPIKVHESVSIKFQTGNEKLEHLFHVLPEINCNIILGRDLASKIWSYGVLGHVVCQGR